MNPRIVLVACCFLVSSLGNSLQAQNVIADSADDWSSSGTQGENNWSNGYYNLTEDELVDEGIYQAEDFIEFENLGAGAVDPFGNHWTGTQWQLFDGAPGPWTRIGRENTHPNGTNSAPSEEHWTIRRWESDLSGTVFVQWHMRHTNVACGGNGVIIPDRIVVWKPASSPRTS